MLAPSKSHPPKSNLKTVSINNDNQALFSSTADLLKTSSSRYLSKNPALEPIPFHSNFGYKKSYKIVVIGDSHVGKTSFIKKAKQHAKLIKERTKYLDQSTKSSATSKYSSSSNSSIDEGIELDGCLSDTPIIEPSYTNNYVDKYLFQIPLDTPANLDSDRKWVNLEVVDIRLGNMPVKKKVFIRKKSFTGYRSRVMRKISRRASIKRNKTFTIPMSKYATDADAFVLMYNLTDTDTMNSISQRWLFEINRMMTINRPIKTLVATHADLRSLKISDDENTLTKNKRLVSKKTGIRFAKEIKAKGYFECSSETGWNCLSVFQSLVKNMEQTDRKLAPTSCSAFNSMTKTLSEIRIGLEGLSLCSSQRRTVSCLAFDSD